MKKILIVEDDKFLGSAYKAKLEKEGYETSIAHDGYEGLKALAEFKPHIILLDLVMPKMDGFEMLRRMKEDPSHKSIPVIIASNLGQKEDVKRGLALGASEFILKSDIQLSEIIKKIKKFIK